MFVTILTFEYAFKPQTTTSSIQTEQERRLTALETLSTPCLDPLGRLEKLERQIIANPVYTKIRDTVHRIPVDYEEWLSVLELKEYYVKTVERLKELREIEGRGWLGRLRRDGRGMWRLGRRLRGIGGGLRG
ncbi:hypothetical protein ROZALSC1DRAFT_28940 [Rozella allomycis CSF55]|uniref:Uncharacterized protein n=1 Tax=Rozella allomycis (strain CSF55) TaxID=988480 RepID=A0A4P9YIS0_ROZAC|nr:hypothetical protein ROZALSC1DRAFT_28940 [Rozella allomycis CSF55]